MADEDVMDPAGRASAPTDPSENTDLSESKEAIVSTDALADLQRERDDYYDRWLRKTAEFDNYRKRVERERREQGDQSVANLLEELLLVVDDLDRAVTTEPGEGGTAYRKGVELIHAKLHDFLKKQGVTPVQAVGADFDPKVHQAVLHETSAGHRDGEVIDELRRGYLINGRLLRPAMVKVAKA
jgi:molecular chaperone GrpE